MIDILMFFLMKNCLQKKQEGEEREREREMCNLESSIDNNCLFRIYFLTMTDIVNTGA
jgi:hypothetical protein